MSIADAPAGFDTLAASRAGPATKADIDNVGARMDWRFAEFDARFDRRFAEFERRMLKGAVFIVLAQPALTVGLIFGLLELSGGAP